MIEFIAQLALALLVDALMNVDCIADSIQRIIAVFS